MDKNICNICGGSYVYKNGKWICSCCDNVRQDEITNEELVLLANAATKLRMADFDSAEELYMDFVKKYPKNSEGYWGLLLSKYGIKYEDDFDGKKIPTVYATSIESVLNDENYKKAIALADKETEKYYKQQANKFESIRQEWVEKASKEQPVDIFICYKDSDEEKDIARTDDSYEAQNLYTYLMSKGYSVFFSRESLRDKVAEKYEPYIFNALNTAHVMIVYSSSKEYLESTWVKNEWTRFLKKIKNKQKQENSLILAFDKMKPSDFPKVFSNVQCMNASQKTFYSDLEKHIQKVIKKATAPITRLERVEVKENVRHKRAKKLDTDIAKREIGSYNVEQLTGDEETQLKTAYKFLNRGLFADADEIITKILDKNSRNGQAILCKLLVNLEAKNIEELENHIDENVDFDELENSIGYSNKDVALQILSALKNACINEFNADNNEFALQLADFICKYNVEDVNFNNRINEVITHLVIKDDIECADKLVQTLLRTLTDNTDSYLEEVEKTIDTFKKQGHFDIASKYVDEYLEIYPTSHKMLWKKISIDLKCRNEVELTSNIFKLEDISVFEKILECTKAGQERDGYIEKLLNIIQKCAEEVTSSEDFSKCCDVFDKIIKYTTQDEKYVKLIFRYAENCQEKGQFTHAEKYYAIVIGEDEQNHNAYWKLLQSKLKVKNNKELIEQPVIITTLSEFHSAIVATGDDEKSADRYIDLKAKQLEYIEKQKILKAKKKHQRKVMSIFAACLAVIFAIGVGLYGWNLYYKSQNQLLYTLEDGTYTVRAGKYYDEKYITIPATYNGKPVTEIEENAFKNKNLEIITIPSTLEEISNNAFYGCDNLKKVEYYNANNNTRAIENNSSMEKIGDYAFYDCISLENIQLSGCLSYLGKYAFANCSSLNEITIPSSLENILEGTFKNAFNDNVESISIPKEVKYVGANAFDCNADNILVDERNSIPTDWATDWFGTSSESEVLWSIPVYFEYTNATGNIGKNKISVVYGKSYECPVPSRNGYSFAGWYLDETQYTGPDGLSIINWNENSAITLEPKWNANNNSIIFNGNGATSGEMANQIIATDSSANLNNNLFVRNGYTFAGWSTTSNGEVEYANGASYTMGVNSSYNLYAVWTPNTNEIVFNPNGATSGEMANQQIKTGFVADLATNEYVRNGYTFAGWSTTRDGEVAYINGDTYTMGPNASYTLYAKWNLNNYVCTLKLNGGSIDQVSSVVFNITSDDIEIKTPKRAGYTFIGWSGDGINGTSMTYTISKGTYSNLEIEANWEANTNEIIFNPNGATSGEMANQQIKTDETVTLDLCQFEKTEYFFVGWATSPDGDVEYVNGASYTMGVNSSYTLYAKWTLSPAQITFNGNGATSGEMNGFAAERETTINIPKNEFLRNGYSFKGWSTTSNGEVEVVDEGQLQVENQATYVLFAIWEANTNKIFFNGNGETSGVMDILEAKTDEILNLPNNLFVRDYYEFKGWATTSNGEVEYVNGASYTMGPNASYTLYAVWEERIRHISTASDLSIIQEDSNANLLAKYELDNNIDLEGAEWTPISKFSGILDGKGFSISNFKITKINTNPDNNKYSFIQENTGTIKNLILNEVSISLIEDRAKSSQPYYVALMVSINEGVLEGCYTSGVIEMDANDDTSPHAGGFVAYNKNIIKNSYTNIDITVRDTEDDFHYVNVGGFVGFNIATISNCYSTGTINVRANTGSYNDGIGGFVGRNGNGEQSASTAVVENSFTTVDLTLTGLLWYYEEFVGQNRGTITGSYKTSEQICKYNGDSNSYNNLQYELSYEELATINALTNKLHYDTTVWNLSDGVLPVLSYQSVITFDRTSGTGTMEDIPVQKNTIITLPNNVFEKYAYDFKGWATSPDGEVIYEDGDNLEIGTSKIYRLYAVWEERIRYISTVAELKSIEDDYSNNIVYNRYLLANDLTIDDNWESIRYGSAFRGHFDGCGYTINFNSTTSQNNSGLFYYIYNEAIVKNLVINCNINITKNTDIGFGALAYQNSGTVINCKVTGSIIVESANDFVNVGGFVDLNTGTIRNCYSEATIVVNAAYTNRVGGICARNYKLVNNCYSTGKLTTLTTTHNSVSNILGGIVGVLAQAATVSDCFSTAELQSTASNAARATNGIVGQREANSTMTNCYFYKNQIIKEYYGTNLTTKNNDSVLSGNYVVENYTNTEFTNMNFNGFVSIDNMQSNVENVWKFIDGKLPILYFENYISYNGNGATFGDDFIEVENNKTTIKRGNFQKSGFELKGWATSPDGEVVYSINQVINLEDEKNYILFAVWEEITEVKNISSKADLLNIQDDINNNRIYKYTLKNNIDLEGAEWTPIQNFNSIFDGCGYTISNFVLKDENNSGLFSNNYGVIRRLKISNAQLISGKQSGFISAQNDGIIENCLVVSSVINSDDNSISEVGGIVGYNRGTINSCYTDVTFEITLNPGQPICIGGIVGRSFTGNINNCFALGTNNLDKGLNANLIFYYGYVVGDAKKETINNCYKSQDDEYDGSNISIDSNRGPDCNVQTLTDRDMFTKASIYNENNLNWNSDIWNIVEGSLPTLKVEV